MHSPQLKSLEDIARRLDELGSDPQSKEWLWISQQMSEATGRKENALMLSGALSTRFDWSTRKQWIAALSDFPMPDIWFAQLARSPKLEDASLQEIAEELGSQNQVTLAQAFHWAQRQPATLISERLLVRLASDPPMGQGAKELLARVRNQQSALGRAQRFFGSIKRKLQTEL
jgi:hypothetical protein